MSNTRTMSEVTLRPWPTEDPHTDDIQLLLHRLHAQRGHFSKITEKSLQDEIDTAKDDEQDAMEGVEGDEAPAIQTEKERKDELIQAKFQMQQYIGSALNEAQVLQDFISLLLSKESPTTAELTMSPALKAAAPKGSLGYDMWPLQEPTPTQNRKQELVAKGWRMKGLEDAADSVLKAATHLENEVRKETKYWEEVLSITEKGWSIRRLPNKHSHKPVLGVQYGFAEASDYFNRRGLAPLRMSEEGNIILDAELTQRAKAVRVRVSEGGKITGTSKLPPQEDASQQSIEKLIHRARDSLFEEELYHEMSLETRQLLSYNVKLRDSVIHLPAPKTSDTSKADRIILIDTVYVDEQVPEIDNHSEDPLAQSVAEALRVLLSWEHRQRLHRRSQIPPPLSEHKRTQSSPPLLRVLLTYFRNAVDVHSVRHYFGRTRQVLLSAGLDVAFKLTYHPALSSLTSTVQDPAAGDLSVLDKIVTILTRPLTSRITFCLPSTADMPSVKEEILLTVRTAMGAPTHGTEYILTVPPSCASLLLPDKDARRDFNFTSFTDLTSYIDLILSLDLSRSLIGKENAGWTGVERLPKLSRQPKQHKKRGPKFLDVQVSNGSITLAVQSLEPNGTEQFSWDGSEGKRSFRDVVKDFVSAH